VLVPRAIKGPAATSGQGRWLSGESGSEKERKKQGTGREGREEGEGPSNAKMFNSRMSNKNPPPKDTTMAPT